MQNYYLVSYNQPPSLYLHGRKCYRKIEWHIVFTRGELANHFEGRGRGLVCASSATLRDGMALCMMCGMYARCSICYGSTWQASHGRIYVWNMRPCIMPGRCRYGCSSSSSGAILCRVRSEKLDSCCFVFVVRVRFVRCYKVVVSVLQSVVTSRAPMILDVPNILSHI